MIDWSKADWAKSDRDISITLGCTASAVYSHRKRHGIPAVIGSRSVVKRYPPVPIAFPVDYERLAAAFVSARWRWGEGEGYPSTQELKRRIEEGLASVASRHNPSACCNSGGISIEWLRGEVVVLLDQQLAIYYKPEQPSKP